MLKAELPQAEVRWEVPIQYLQNQLDFCSQKESRRYHAHPLIEVGNALCI